MQITMDKAGRVVLPQPLRRELGLEAGDVLSLTQQGANIVLQPVRNTSPLQKEKGVWVYRTGKPISAALIRRVQDATRRNTAAPAEDKT